MHVHVDVDVHIQVTLGRKCSDARFVGTGRALISLGPNGECPQRLNESEAVTREATGGQHPKQHVYDVQLVLCTTAVQLYIYTTGPKIFLTISYGYILSDDD